MTVSDCIMDALPRPEFWDWFQNLPEALVARSSQAALADITPVAMRTGDSDLLISTMGGRNQPYFDTLAQELPYEGEILGFEVVGAEEPLDFHSWHCHGYADEVRDELHVLVNDLGLLSTYADAMQVLTWMLARPAREAPAPVPWVVVALGRPPPPDSLNP
jgi:hypothetical protein